MVKLNTGRLTNCYKYWDRATKSFKWHEPPLKNHTTGNHKYYSAFKGNTKKKNQGNCSNLRNPKKKYGFKHTKKHSMNWRSHDKPSIFQHKIWTNRR